MARRKDGEATKLKILESALEYFAIKGFVDATNALICESCGCNAASVAYYFGNKETLYKNVFVYGMEKAWQESSLKDCLPSTSAKIRVQAFIDWLVNMGIKHRYISHIVLRELSHWSGILDEEWKCYIKKPKRDLNQALAEYYGGTISDEQLLAIAHFICFHCVSSYILEDLDIQQSSHLLEHKNMSNFVFDMIDSYRQAHL